MRPKLDDEVAVERRRDSEQRVDARRASSALEPRDRRLRRAAELGELLLREAHLRPARGDPLGDLREEPALIRVRELAPELLERRLARLRLVSHVCYIAVLLCRSQAASSER